MGHFKARQPSTVDSLAIAVLSPEARYSVQQSRNFVASQQEHYAEIAEELLDPTTASHELARELTSPLTVEGGGQKFGALWLNRDVTDENGDTRVLIYENGFQTNVTTEDQRIRAFFLARNFPEHNILMVDQASHGLSDNYTPTQRAVMFTRGDLTGTGKNKHRAYQNFMFNIEEPSEVLMSGDSYGTRQGLEVVRANLADASAVPIDAFQAKDLPGTVRRRFGIHLSFFGNEVAQDRIRYSSTWLNDFKASFKTFLETYGHPLPATAPNFLTKDKLCAARNFWRSVLGFATGLESFEEVIDSGIPVSRLVGEASRIDNPNHALEQHTRLEGRFLLAVMRHTSHSGMGHLTTFDTTSKIAKEMLMRSKEAGTKPGQSPFEVNLSEFAVHQNL